MTATLLSSALLAGHFLSRAAPPAEDPELGLGWPGLDPAEPCLDFYLYDHSGSIMGLGGNDPIGARFTESEKAIQLVRAWTTTRNQKLAIVHFDQPSDSDSGVVTLRDRTATRRISASLTVPGGRAGTSNLMPSLRAVDALMARTPQHVYRLTIFSDFELMDPNTEEVFQRLLEFPGQVHAVVLNAEPPPELVGCNITITRIRPGDPPGAVAAAVHRSLTATRNGRRLSELHAERTQPSVPPLSPTEQAGGFQ